jgi:hypothetical protein
MIQSINRARANPAAEAQRLLAVAQTDPVVRDASRGWDLAAFAREMTATPASPPLAPNPRLVAAARDRVEAMLASNDQRHAPGGFLVNPAYGLVAGDGQPYYPVGNATWATGENLFAYSGNVAGAVVRDYVDYFHAGLLIDWGNPDFGHLKNLLAPGPSQAAALGRRPFSEIGVGLLANVSPTIPPPANPSNPANRGLDVGPVLVAQEFAWKTGHAFLTGAAFRDGDGDRFYTPGEGLGGVTIQAQGLNGQGNFSATTWDSGGYALALPPGTYSVTASGASDAVRTQLVTIGEDNVGWDLMYSAETPADLPVPADYDGDGQVDVAVYRASTGQWFIQASSLGTTPPPSASRTWTCRCRPTTTATAGPTSPSTGRPAATGTSSAQTVRIGSSPSVYRAWITRCRPTTTVTERPTWPSTGPPGGTGSSSARAAPSGWSPSASRTWTCRCRPTTTATARPTSPSTGPPAATGSS